MSGHPGSHFGTQLKKERLMRGWGLEDLARETGINPAHLSRIESGKRPPTERIASACDKALPHRHGWFTEYWQELQGWSEVPSWFKPWSEHELIGATIRSWQPGTVDGLLQTEDYARAQIALRPGITPEKTAERVANRMTRQQRVLHREDPPLAHFLLDITALRRMPGQLIPAQLRRLLEVAVLPNVTLQVVPECWHNGTSGALILTDSAAYTEGLISGQVFADEQNVSELSRRFAMIASEAMGASGSQALIREMLNRERLAKVKLLRRGRQRLRRDR
jgi:transcriptional regulator with XRE-family HTH domain